jgi:hypothetical protein
MLQPFFASPCTTFEQLTAVPDSDHDSLWSIAPVVAMKYAGQAVRMRRNTGMDIDHPGPVRVYNFLTRQIDVQYPRRTMTMILRVSGHVLSPCGLNSFESVRVHLGGQGGI